MYGLETHLNSSKLLSKSLSWRGCQVDLPDPLRQAVDVERSKSSSPKERLPLSKNRSLYLAPYAANYRFFLYHISAI